MSVVLTLNAGSSSLKFSVWPDGAARTADGQVERLGPRARLVVQGETRDIGPADHAGALAAILEVLGPQLAGREVAGVGHRIVHGGPDRAGPMVLDAAEIAALAELEPLAPLHQPHNLSCLRAAQEVFPKAVQVGCFDTAFHRGQPWVQDTFGLPRTFYDAGVRRYGFHGLSYDYIEDVLRRDFPALHAGRVVVAHLGNGASICAMKGGRSLSSTMGFSALDGLCMGTRSGQIDPGVLLYLMDQRGMGAQDITRLLYKQSGLLGLSGGISSDMRTLLGSKEPAAAEAVDYFVARLTREVGALAADLGGIDGLVFTGGIGENSDVIRARAVDGLRFLGLEIDAPANEAGATEIGAGPVAILRIETDEEAVIARSTRAALA